MSSWGVVWVSPKSVVNLFLWWKDCKMRKGKRLTWDATPVAVLWAIWNLRNKLVFENATPDWDIINGLIKSRIA